MAVADGSSIPLAIHVESASPHEVILVGRALATGFLKEKPERLVGERAYDSDPLDEALQEQGIEMIAPHRKKQEKEKDAGRTQAQTLQETLEDREALLGWLSNFRRLVVRYEYKAENFLGMVQLGCIVILLRKCL
jgi:transposase